MKKFLYISIMLFVVGWVQAQQRVIYTINDGWKFVKGSPFEAQLLFRMDFTFINRRNLYMFVNIFPL